MSEQLAFHLPVKTTLGRDDFFVAPANALAVAVLADWGNWPLSKIALIGPKGAGKTHLTHVWAAQSGAQIIAAEALADADIEQLAQGPVAVEDVPNLAGHTKAEENLFHLHNLGLANGNSLLLTADQPPSRWPLKLPDLASRMQGTAITRIDAPDDALLAAVLIKQFGDRQLAVDPGVVAYLVKRMDRSLDVARSLVTALDHAALARRQAITRPLAGEVLDNFTSKTA